MQVLQPRPGDVGVDLGGGQVAVAEQHLHHPQVGAVVEQVRGEGMAQGVGREGFIGPACAAAPVSAAGGY